MSDPCKHAFHSYLCHRSRKVGKSLDRQPQFNFDTILSTTAKPLGIPRPASKRPKSMPTIDKKCSHPFHSWLCDVAKNLQKKNKESSAIDDLIDSDRFLLKKVNIPDIMALPLDNENDSSYQPFTNRNFADMNLDVPLASRER